MAEGSESLPPEIIPEASYKARLIDRRYDSDTWEIQEPGSPWHGRRFTMHPMPIQVSVQVKHLVVSLPSGGTQTVVQARPL